MGSPLIRIWMICQLSLLHSFPKQGRRHREEEMEMPATIRQDRTRLKIGFGLGAPAHVHAHAHVGRTRTTRRRPSIPNFQFPPTAVEDGGGPHIGSTLDSLDTSLGPNKANRNTENQIILDQAIYFGSKITFCRNMFGCFSKKSVSFVGRKKS